MASLDFSIDKLDDSSANIGSHDVQSLVDQSSLGTRTQDGMYEVKDWDFFKDKNARDETDDAISQALKPLETKTPSSEGSLGAFSSILARLTGSKILREADLKPVLEAMKQHLMNKNVAMDISEKICEGVGESLVGKKVVGFQSKILFNLLMTFLIFLKIYSYQQCRASGTFNLIDENINTQNIDRFVIIYSGEIVGVTTLQSTTNAIQHNFCWCQWCRQKH